MVLLSVDYEGVADGVYYADAGSTCSETARKSWNKITAAKEWDYMEDTAETRFKFNQSVSITYSRFPRRPISIIATSTIINPTLVNGELWDCQIQGDGSIQSYGLYGRRDSCIMFLYCIKINKQSEIKSEWFLWKMFLIKYLFSLINHKISVSQLYRLCIQDLINLRLLTWLKNL